MSIQAMAWGYVVLSIAVSYQQGNSRGQAVSLWKMGRPGRLSIGRAGRNEPRAPAVQSPRWCSASFASPGEHKCTASCGGSMQEVPEHEGIDTIDYLSHLPPSGPLGSSPSELSGCTSDCLRTLWCSSPDGRGNIPGLISSMSQQCHTNYWGLCCVPESNCRTQRVSKGVFEFSP